MTPQQKALHTKFGMYSADYQSFELAYKAIPKKYKRWKRMLKHQMDKLEKSMRETEKQFTYYGE